MTAFDEAFTKMARYEIGPTRMWDVEDVAETHWDNDIKDELREKFGENAIIGSCTNHSRNHVKINMTPNQFLAAAAPLTIDVANPYGDSYPPDSYDDEGKLKRRKWGLYPSNSQPYMNEMMNEMGKGRPFGMPNLNVHQQDGNWRVGGHEGRHRMKSLVDMGYGDVTIPVTASHHHFEDEESYSYGGNKALRDALHGGNLMSQSEGNQVMQIDVTDPQNWEVGRTIPIETGEPMEIAFQLLKVDTGMWDEIYAPLLAQTGGMGEKQKARNIIDWMPSDVVVDNIKGISGDYLDNLYNADKPEGKGDDQWSVEQLMESILEHGFQYKPGNLPLDPSFRFDDKGMKQYEGRHRALALDKLGAPYIPYMGRYSSRYNSLIDDFIDKPNPHIMPLGGDFTSAALDFNRPHYQYSLGGYMGDKSRIPIPPSFLYGRELVSGKGRLMPVDWEGNALDVLSHIGNRADLSQWKRNQRWDVIHDE